MSYRSSMPWWSSVKIQGMELEELVRSLKSSLGLWERLVWLWLPCVGPPAPLLSRTGPWAALGCSALLRHCWASSLLGWDKAVSPAWLLVGASGAGVKLGVLTNISALLGGTWCCRAARHPCPPAECWTGFPTMFGVAFSTAVTLPAGERWALLL